MKIKYTLFNSAHNIDDFEKILISHPFFSGLSEKDIVKLLKLAIVKNYSQNEIIVRQGDNVDAVYLIVSGNVEVSKEDEARATKPVLEVILNPGDAIGLNDTGFFSKNGIRTATLRAVTDVTLIGWQVEAFIDFLQTHPEISTVMEQTADLILRLNFIKKLAFFTPLASHEIAEIAGLLEEREVKSGTILFRQGEKSEECYLIHSGKVEINIQENDKLKSIILEAPMIFGELALLTDSLRNGSARMIESGKLLVINKNLFQKILLTHETVAKSIVSLAMERSRPKRSPNVEDFSKTNPDGEKIEILKNIKLKTYYKLTPLDLFVWNKIDGLLSIDEVIAKGIEENIGLANNIRHSIINLADSGFIVFVSALR